MEIQQLEQFYTIAQCGNVTKAAQKLHMSQPSLSRSLHALETELGASLFDRIGRNISLNDTGRFVLKRAADILNSAEILKRDTEQFIQNENLSLDIYSPVPMGDMEEIIIKFKHRYPNVRIRKAAWHSERLKNVIPDITFFASPIIHKEPNYLLLGEERVIIAVSRENPLSHNDSLRLADLANEEFVSVLSDSPFYEIASHMFLEAGFKPNIIAEDQDYNQVFAYVANNFGIAVAPEITWFGRWKKDIAAIPISDIHRKRYLYLKWPENTIMNWATLRFREFVIDHFNSNYGFTCSLNS